jgi:hypothetical protein
MSQPHAVAPPPPPPVVSLQARDAEDFERGHLATGLLVDRGVVFVPAPPPPLLDLAGRFEVLIFPSAPLAGDSLIERIRPAGLTVPYSEVGHQPPLGATIRLSRPSRNALSIQREPGRPAVTGQALAQRLADGQDLWTALTELRAIGPTLRRAPSKAMWKRLRDAERNAGREAEADLDAAGTIRARGETAGRPTPGGHQPGSLQALGFNACWLVPWWCRSDD